jgi:pyruvate kinase
MTHKKTKIVCTIGPASWDFAILKKLAVNGMNVARLNFSHGTHEEKGQAIKNIRKISEELGKPIAILGDMSGPKLRLGEIDGKREIKSGEKIQLSLNPVEGELPMQFDLSPFVKKGQRVFLNDGLVELKVDAVKGKTISTVAQNSGVVSSHKGINIPDTNLKGAAFTDKDYEDAEFALKEGVDYLGLSFVQNVAHIQVARDLLKKHKSSAKIITKIEKNEAIQNLEEIILASDAVMVARGDLAIETPASEVPIVQQKIIKISRQLSRPVIVATQMLESMTENPRPTRAETSDVANAVLDQVDAVMLSAESASGKYPVEAVKTMNEIIYSVERNPDYKRYIKVNWDNLEGTNLVYRAIASSAASIAYRIGAQVIAAGTATGKSARLLSSFRPDAQIVAVTHEKSVWNQSSLLWGVRSVVVKPTDSFAHFVSNILDEVKDRDFAKKGDKIVIITGSSIGTTGGTDVIKVATI